ncbi:MAG: putative DNA binding domain-containing protein [Phycisphaeraceae bacterium]|nr:putative DNA binding domain-containing protein [Phycisphaeraceae bacterium]
MEFKHNNVKPEEIGEYISALSNSAALLGKVNAYLIWGVSDESHKVIGTTFRPRTTKVKGQELESWLLQLLKPKINFRFYELQTELGLVVLMEIGAAFRHPVQFQNIEYIRVGSYKKKLKDFPEKERELWRVFDKTPFERDIAVENISSDEVLRLLDYQSYFRMLSRSLPENPDVVIQALSADDMIGQGSNGQWNITNLGAVLFARHLADFRNLKRKMLRVIAYKGQSRVEIKSEQEGAKGYASGFEGLIDFIINLLPTNEVMGSALRKDVPVFPILAIRELVANAIIHQDFHSTGTAPMFEIFSNRMEITNPGLPLVEIDRFLGSPPKSRNEILASFMRRIGVCEERGSGIVKVVFQTELYQLPAPFFETTQEHTRAVLFAHKELKEMDKEDRIRACYLHACLRYVERDYMVNASLRKRFGIDDKNSAMASRIIKDTLEAKLIRPYDDAVGNKAKKYLPSWA